MICPNCNLYIDDPRTARCPRCGQSLSSAPGSTTPGEQFPPGPTFPADQAGLQPGFSTPASGQWMKPSLAPVQAPPRRRSSRLRRNLISIAVMVCIIAVCAGALYGYFALNSSGNQPSSSNTLPGTNVIFSDPLNSPASGWSNDTNHCFFQNNAYHVRNNFYCLAPAGNIADANITVQAQQVAGTLIHAYGIVFRRTSDGNWYEFDIDSNSKWLFFKVVNNTQSVLVNFTPNAAIKGGLNTINTLRVEAKGSHFVFFVNGTQVGEADDTSFASGQVGLSAGGTDTEVAYTNFEITKVS